MSEIDPCCKLRKKVVLGIMLIRSEAECGVPDSEMADVMAFDESKSDRPIICVQYCPWCGAKIELDENSTITEIDGDPE